MNAEDFRRILSTFTDTPANVDMSRGRLVAQIRDQLIDAKLLLRQGAVVVTEGSDCMPAESWLVNRVARIPQLADCLLSAIPENKAFVAPSGRLLDRLDLAPTDEFKDVDNISLALRASLDSRPAGVASVLYLTSGAGEGKTTVINELARHQAEQYRNKETDWLLVPIPLGGRTFMRFDDVVAGALLNRYRFQYLYYESFIALVRMGVVIPAFDGFEEMFIETATGEAASALGGLLQLLNASGSVLIAARKAYFEFKGLETQSRLFDTLGGQSAAFAQLAINRWSRQQFLDYCAKAKLGTCQQVYEEACSVLGSDHPVLTRPVLVKRLLIVLEPSKDRAELLRRLRTTPQEFFDSFVRTIVEREVTDKWIDKTGEPAQPLLSVAEHIDLLTDLAEEMWVSNTEVLFIDMVDFVTEAFCQQRSKSPVVTRQVMDRIKHHALLTPADGRSLRFDHEEFLSYFLGLSVGKALRKTDQVKVRNLLRNRVIPEMSVKAAAHCARVKDDDRTEQFISVLCTACQQESRGSCIRDSAGGICIELLDGRKHPSKLVIEGLSFLADCFRRKDIHGVLFRNCYFYPMTLEQTTLRECRFEECSFDRIDLGPAIRIDKVAFVNVTVHGVIGGADEATLYDPAAVRARLAKLGVDFPAPAGAAQPAPPSPGVVDTRVALAERVFRTFLRATEVNENVFRMRLGEKQPEFFNGLLPDLLRVGVLTEVQYLGSGKQARYKITMPLQMVQTALRDCAGRYDRFLEIVSRPRQGDQ
ncbi:MAG: hypothetical protein NTW87_11455 [Planctomycetota bacterium]|nr:hypothetical protein [Planctomycetota bacterium]